MTAQPSAVSSESWDDDFEFSQNNPSNDLKSKHDRTPEAAIHVSFEPRFSLASSHFSEDWDTDDALRHRSPKVPVAPNSRTLAHKSSGISSRLDNWVEPGPSTPTKLAGAQAPSENWDDDFEDKADSPPNRRHHAQHHLFQHIHYHALRTRHSYHTPPRPKPSAEPENWDDDFDDPMDPTSSTSPVRTDNDNTPVTKRSRRDTYPDTSDEDEDPDFGLSEDKEEDKTLTAHSRTAPMLRPGSSNSLISPPPVPTLPRNLSPSPIEPFPRSPAVSVFSIPTTSGRNSVGHFNSTSHLILSGAAASLSMLPPSPPHRERRRRLRKKSRPQNMDDNVFELIEEQRDSSSPPLPPSTPERERASSPPTIPMLPSSSVEATPSGASRTPLLSRIGSVKKWGVRRKRASTGPAEVMMQEFRMSSGGLVEEDGAPRPPSSLEQSQLQMQAQTPSNQSRSNAGGARSAWFFRPGGAHSGAGSPPPRHAELKHEESLDRMQLRPEAGERGGAGEPVTPNRSKKLFKRKASGALLEQTSSSEFTGDGSSSASGVAGIGKPSLGAGRRPTSMQVPNGVALAVGSGSTKFSSVGTRHASYGSSIGRVTSSRVFSAPTPTDSMEDIPPMPTQEGSRGLMGSVRKISFVGGKKHKKKSSAEISYSPPSAPATSLPDDTAGDNANEPAGGRRLLDADGDARMATPPCAHIPDLLPPIELHPPSPPRNINVPQSISLNIGDGVEPIIPSSSAPSSVTIGASTSPVVNKAILKTPSSPQSASLGRATQVPGQPPSNASVPRRNSLGDLKIPARISQAQIGLKRDLGMVREFATSVDRLKELQLTYHRLLTEMQTFLDSAPPSRATSPNMFGLVHSRSRLRSNTSPSANTTSPGSSRTFVEHRHIAATLHAITARYKVSWECAELLIELGRGAPTPPSPAATGPSSSISAPSVNASMSAAQAELDRRKNRERAITLSGDDSKLPVNVGSSTATATSSSLTTTTTSGPSNTSWRVSTGRHDLSQRQLVLLRDMLNSGELPSDDAPPFEENMNVNRNWRWGDAMSSTVTLPSEESSSRGAADPVEIATKKKRRGRRMGLTGLRDMLRMLKWSHQSEQATTSAVRALPTGPSSVSLSTESSHCSHHHYLHGQIIGADGRVRKTSIGPESVRDRDTSANSLYGSPPVPRPALNHKSSPRRPSLASIFRIGQKNRNIGSSSAGESSQDSRSDVRSASRGSTMTGDEEDWDRIESAIDLDTAARVLGVEGGMSTIKGRKGRMSPFLSENNNPGTLPGQQASGLTHATAIATAHRPVTPRRLQEAAALGLEMEASPRSLRPMRSTRLSNVEEVEDAGGRPIQLSPSIVSLSSEATAAAAKIRNRVSLPRTSSGTTHRPPSRGTGVIPSVSASASASAFASRTGGNSRTGSVRSVPPALSQPVPADSDPALQLSEMKLSMTPENIKPLLENAKEVHVRCYECVRELRALVDAMSVQAGSSSTSLN